MNLSPQLKEFLRRPHILEMIDENQWNEFYTALADFDWNNIYDVTAFLQQFCGIDPLPHMCHVPPNYRCKDTTLTKLELHNGIITVHERAFMDCINLETVIINPSCDKVYEYAFKGCINLKTVYIKGAKTHIDPLAFCFLNDVRFIINCKNEDMISLFDDVLKYDVTVVRGD